MKKSKPYTPSLLHCMKYALVLIKFMPLKKFLPIGIFTIVFIVLIGCFYILNKKITLKIYFMITKLLCDIMAAEYLLPFSFG